MKRRRQRVGNPYRDALEVSPPIAERWTVLVTPDLLEPYSIIMETLGPTGRKVAEKVVRASSAKIYYGRGIGRTNVKIHQFDFTAGTVRAWVQKIFENHPQVDRVDVYYSKRGIPRIGAFLRVDALRGKLLQRYTRATFPWSQE